MKNILLIIAFQLLTDITCTNKYEINVMEAFGSTNDNLGLVERRAFDGLEGFNWTDGLNIIPNENVPIMDIIMHSPNDPDVDLVSEGLLVQKEVMYNLRLLMTSLKKNHPYRTSPLRKATFNQWKQEYEEILTYMIDELKRTRHMKYSEKMQAWLEFRLGVEHMFKVVGTKWINKLLYNLPKTYSEFWRHRISQLRKREAKLMKELAELRKGKPPTPAPKPGISSGKKPWKKT